METIERCLRCLQKNTSDSEKLAALMVLSKVCEMTSITEVVAAQLFEAISPMFLRRLLRENSTEHSNDNIRLIGINILSFFSRTYPQIILKGEESEQLLNQVLDIFDPSKKSENSCLYADCIDIILGLVRSNQGAKFILQCSCSVFTQLSHLILLEKELAGKVISIFQSLLCFKGSINGDFMDFLNMISHSFKSNQELLKFQYLEIINKLFEMIVNSKLQIEYVNDGLVPVLNNISAACKDIMQSHVKSNVKRSVMVLLSNLLKICGREWIFDQKCVGSVSKFVLLLLTVVSVELTFLLHSKVVGESEDDDHTQAHAKSGFHIAQCILIFVCSNSFECHELVTDCSFISNIFSILKSILASVYELLYFYEQSDIVSLQDPVLESMISLLSIWVTEETEHLREELKDILPYLVKIGQLDLEQVKQNNHISIFLDIMAPGIMQIIPEKKMRTILVADKCHQLYAEYLLHLLAVESSCPKPEKLEALFHMMHQFIILEPALCNESPTLKELSVKLLNFILYLPSTNDFSCYSCLEIIVVTLSLIRIYKMECTESLEEVTKVSTDIIHNLTESSEEVSEIWFIAIQNVIACLDEYKQLVNGLQHIPYLRGWANQVNITEDQKNVIAELFGVVNSSFSIFQLFKHQGCERTYNSMMFLCCILRCSNFPNYPKSLESNVENENDLKNHPMRRQLLEWLLPLRSEILEPIVFKKNSVNVERDEMELLCALVSSLICVSPANALQSMPERQPPRKAIHTTFKEKQEKCILSMIDPNMVEVKAAENEPPENQLKMNCKCLKEAEVFLLKKIELVANQLLASTEKDAEVCIVEFFVFLTILMEKLQAYTNSYVLINALRGYSEKLMNKFLSLMETLVTSENSTTSKAKRIANCLRCLDSLVLSLPSVEITYHLPESLVELLNQIVEGAFISSLQITQNRTCDQLNSSFDEMDVDCDESDSLYNTSNKGYGNPLDIDSLDDVEKVQLSAFTIVVKLMLLNQDKYEHQRRNFFTVFMVKEENNAKLQMFVVLHAMLDENGFQFSSSELSNSVNCARHFLSAHRFDMDVCDAILTGIVCYINQLKMIDNEQDNGETRMNVLQLIEVFWSLKTDRYSPAVRIKLTDTLEALSQIKHAGDEWKLNVRNKMDGAETLVCASDLFVQMLCDRNLTVRTHTALRLDSLFSNNAEHSKLFELVCVALDQLINMEHSHITKDDQFFTHEITVLLVSKKMIYCSSNLERKGLWLLFQFAKQQIAKQEHVFKILQDISVVFGYDNLHDMISSRIMYIIFTFILKEFAIDTFPSQCLGLSTLDFLRRYYQKIVPCYVLRNNFEAIEAIGNLLGFNYDVERLLLDSFELTVVHTLPIYSGYLDGGNVDEKKSLILDGSKAFRFRISEEVYNVELEKRFDAIVLQLMLRIHDSPRGGLTLSKFTLPTDASPYYPTFSSTQITISLSHLAVAFNKDITISSFLKFPESIPNILCNLALHITSSKRSSERLSPIRSYYYFSMFLLENLHHLEDYGGNYVIREIIYRVLYFIEENVKETNENSRRVVSICFEVLETFCERISSHLYVSKELSKNLYFIVSKLIHFTASNATSPQALKILQYLIIDSTQNEDFLEYITAVSLLDDFPSLPKFTQLNERLVAVKREKQLNGFNEELRRIATNLLNLDSVVPNSVLENLKRILAEKAESIVLGEPLKQLVFCLMRICSQGDEESSLLAVDCLGLIGPMPISALNGGGQMQSSELPHHLFSVCPLKFYVVIEALLQLCVHKCSLISKTSWYTILRLIKWEDSKDILKSYREMPFFSYIQPYLAKSRRRKVDKLKNNPSLEKLTNSIFGDKEKGFDSIISHELWLRNLVSSLLTSAPVDSQIFFVLEPICQLHVDFARLSFTFVVHNMIISDEENKRIMNLACQSWIEMFLAADEETRKKYDMKKKMMEIIYLITSLRSIDISTNQGKGVNTWNNNFWLDIDYLQLADAAFRCGQYYNAAMFIEIWSDPLRESGDQVDANQKTDPLSSTNFNCGSPECQSLLYNIYSNIGDVDAIHGVDTNTSMQTQKRLQILQCEKEFHKALLTSDLRCSSMKCSSDVLESLMKSELYHTALMYLQSVPDGDADQFSEIQFEAAWRNGLWNTTQLRQGLSSKEGFHASLYQCFLSVESQEEELFEKNLINAKSSIVNSIQIESNSTKSLYGILSRCFTLSSLETAGNSVLRNTVDGIKHHSVLSNDFSYYEPSLSAVSQIIKIGCINSEKDNRNELLEKSAKHLINHCMLARESQRYEIAEKFISTLSSMNGIANASPEWKIEEAKVYWDRKETNQAMNVLRQLMNQVKPTGKNDKFSYMYPMILGLYGHWLGETKSQNPVHIMTNYLEPAISMMEEESSLNFNSPIDAYHSLAKYADAQFQSLREYVKSPMFQTKQAVIKRNQDELGKYNTEGRKQNTDHMLELHFKMLEKQCTEDESELQQTLKDHKTFLEKAVQNYCKCLQHGDKYNLKVLRLCSLWFEHYSEDVVNNQTKIGFAKIKSSKFLPVMYQLAARLGTKMATQCNTFKDILETVIERCCNDHPHHSIFILLALCNADYEENMNAKPKKRQSKGASKSGMDEADKSRINAAKSVLERVRSSKAHLVQDAEKLAMAYIDLAYWDISHLKTEKGPFSIHDSRLIRKIASLSSVAIPTVEIEVDPTCEYENVTHILRFDTTFTHAGGINLPKIITCVGSDGCRRKQLIKGRDDLRQDAVMQQVFGVVNLLLKSDPETRRRDLRMRTYKIVPLSRKSGLMEWCEGTVPLGTYLAGGRDGTIGAHVRYYPKDWSIKECRQRLHSATMTDGKRSKYVVYQEIQKHFHPVFRHFFYEKFRDPADWFAKRLCYTRSTAVNSIVGYIVGLGDRHVHNILVDCNSAEVVHIDLGVAFEKGKLLPTPETIPFRLTRDIIDGMGINGIEGVFRRCCEKTMGVMRTSHEGILTIVEVLLYDPLSDWTISSEKLRKLQKRGDSEENGDMSLMNVIGTGNSCSEIDSDRNKTAERVLMRVKQKLAGSEGGAFLGTQGHVNYLIQEACNPQNLCRLFPGWQPWL